MAAHINIQEYALTLECIVCSHSFSFTKKKSGRHPRFCSPKCKRDRNKQKAQEHAQRKAIGLSRRNKYPAGVLHPKKIVEFSCEQCGRSCQRKHSALGNRFCSDDCRNGWFWQKHLIDTSDLRGSRPCQSCGKPFAPDRLGKVHCTKGCRVATQDGVKRARKRNATVERVSPFRVFERDGWRCQLCGCKTLRSKRGTIHPRAPELDHIMPLSKGGEHSYANTHCACKTCNASKNNRPKGQMLLFG